MAVAGIKNHHGAPTLFIDGNPCSPLWFFGPTDIVSRLANRGTGIAVLSIGTDLGWTDVDSYDYSHIDDRIDKILSVNSDTYLYLQADCNSPAWWNELHPDELTVYDDGSVDEFAAESYGSDLWRQETGNALAAFVKHIRQTELGKRVIGFQAAGGFALEWNKHKAQNGLLWDFSPAMAKAFSEWVRTRYSNPELVSKAWNKKINSFDDIEVPNSSEQLECDLGIFRDPSKSTYVSDYFRCRSELWAKSMIHFCSTIQRASQNECVSGVSGEYIFEQLPGAFYSSEGFTNYHLSMVHNWGHQAFYMLLHSPHIDFIHNWATNLRRMGGSDAGPVTAPESVTANGKLFVCEFDARTFLAAGGGDLGRIKTKEESIAVNQRDFCHMLAPGSATILANLGQEGTWHWPNVPNCDWYDDPDLISNLAVLNKIGKFDLELSDRAPQADIAVIMDDQSLHYQSLSANLMYALTSKWKAYELSRIGAPYHVYMLDDLEKAAQHDYRCYIFASTFFFTTEQRRLVKNLILKDNRAVIWVYAPGFINENRIALENITDMTGINMGMDDDQWGLNIAISNFEHPITVDLPSDFHFGIDSLVGPILFCQDDEATTLGTVSFNNARTEPGFCIKEFSDWTSIYVAAPMLPALLIRRISSQAGAHIYSDTGDVIYANGNWVVVHTNKGGPRLISLPVTSNQVYDVFDRQVIAQNVSEFTADIPRLTTKLYFVGKEDLGRELLPE